MGRRVYVRQVNVEEILKDYYKEKRLIPKYQEKIELLKKEDEQLEERLRKNDYTLSTELTALTISEKIQATTEGLSQQEKEMYKQCQCLLNRQQLIWDKINAYEEIILQIKLKANDVEIALEILKEEEKQFIELKYNNEKQWLELMEEMHISKSTVKYRNDKIMNKLKKYL